MTESARLTVHGEDGPIGTIAADDAGLEHDEGRVLIRVDDDLSIAVPRGFLQEQDDGTFLAPIGREELLKLREADAEMDAASCDASSTHRVIPVLREEIRVQKRTVETGRVRVRKTVRERPEEIDVPLLTESVEVERVPVNRPLEGPATPRQEGDVTINPVVEEVLVVEKRLMVREEVRIRRVRSETHHRETVVLRGEEVIVNRDGDGAEAATTGA